MAHVINHSSTNPGTEQAIRANPRQAGRLPKRLDPTIPIVLFTDENGWGGAVGGSGTAGYVLMLARGLKQRGYRVATICDPAEGGAKMRRLLTEVGVEVRQIPTNPRPSPVQRVKRHFELSSLIGEYSPCVLALMMGYYTSGGAITLAAAVNSGTAIVRADLTAPEPPVTWRQRLSLKLADALVYRIVVGADENRAAFARRLGRNPAKVEIVHTGIEMPRYRPGQGRAEVRSEFGFSTDTQVVGMIARLADRRKGVIEFLDMAAEVSASAPKATFLIVGDGTNRSELEQRAADRGLADRIVFAGWRADIPALLAAMDVFVMPSLYEGGPTIVLEAMAMARPVVSTNVGMVPEIVQHEHSGLVVPPGDPWSLAESVTRLLFDSHLRDRLGENARAQAERRFSIDGMVDHYLELFGEAFEACRGAVSTISHPTMNRAEVKPAYSPAEDPS